MSPIEVKTTLWGMEYSLHDCPEKYRKEVQHVFPDVDLSDMVIVPTCQHADVDLVRTGEKIEDEKDRLLERFMEWGKSVCLKLEAQGYWSDYIDPCSGLAMIHREYQHVYPEVEGLSVLLQYKTQNAGCCKIVLHPKWGSSVYPASVFSKAPRTEIIAAIAQTEKELASLS